MARSLRTIVIGTSLTEASDGVVRTGAAIARAAGATPWLVHSYLPYLPIAFASGGGIDTQMIEEQVTSLQERITEQARRTGLSAVPGFSSGQVRLVVGSPHREIVELARHTRAGLVIVGAAESSHGILGSTADRVIRKAPCPVLAVRTEAAFPPSRVEIPVDLSPSSANALRHGLDLLAQIGAPPAEPEVLFVLDPLEAAGSLHFTEEQVQRFAREELHRFLAANLPESTRPCSERVRLGYPRQEILAALTDGQVDLAVLGTQGRGGFERLMIGSVAAWVLRNARCNLLVVPPAASQQDDSMSEHRDADWSYVSDEDPAAASERAQEEPMTIQHSLSPLVRPHRRLRQVLIGTELGDESDPVVRAGLAVARAAGAQVFLVHAAQPGSLPVGFDVGAGPELEREQIARCHEELRRQVERLGIDGSELAGFQIRTGAPNRVLIKTAQQIGAGLIVVGATGSGPLAAKLLGSTADRVVRKAVCPVLVVREGLHVPPRRVLAPVDLSTLSGDAFHHGLHLLTLLAGGGESRVQAVFALGLQDTAAARQPTGQIPPEQVERSAGEELRRFVLENRPETPLDVDTAILPGEARAEILHDLQAHPTDLLIMGTHGRSGLDRLMLGSVASTLIRQAPCSVLVISPEASLADGIAEAVVAGTTPAWHAEPAPAL